MRNSLHALWRLNFYASTRSPIRGEQRLPRDDKIHLFTSMYSVAVESSSETHFEKGQRYTRPLLKRVLETADLLAVNESHPLVYRSAVTASLN